MCSRKLLNQRKRSISLSRDKDRMRSSRDISRQIAKRQKEYYPTTQLW